MKKRTRQGQFIRTLTAVSMFGVFLFCGKVLCSVPPHPRVDEQIKKGIIALPYHLAKPAEARSRGINAPNRLTSYKEYRTGNSITSSAFNALVILVQFPDREGRTSGKYFDTLLFSEQYNSLRKYYREISYGQMDIVTVNLPGATGWRSVTNDYSYYVDGANGFGAYPRNAQKLVEEAVAGVDSSIDFSKYDNDHDGYVDALFIVHAGSGAEYTGSVNDIWSHEWATYTPILLDGVYIYTYTIEPEYWQNPSDMTCGVFAHEMGHAVFNLPDLYDYDQDSKGLGRWSLMATGSWNGTLGNSPAHPDPWSLMKMGFVSAQTILFDSLNFEFPAIEESARTYKVIPSEGDGSEYYLIENRQKIGFDSQLRGSGLLIYHVDENQFGNSNQWYPGYIESGHYKIALVQADGKWDLEQNHNGGDAGDPYPGSSMNNRFNSASSPDSKNYSGQNTNIGITDIHPAGTNVYSNIFVQNCSPVISVTPMIFSLNMNTSDTASQTIDMSNRGAENLVYSIHLDSVSSPGFPSAASFRFDPDHGTITPDGNQKLSISVSGAGLTGGSYAAYFRIRSNDTLQPALDLRMNLTVNIQSTPDQVTFGLKRGWNMVSLPLLLPDNSVSEVFPGSNGKAYYYVDKLGYQSTLTMNDGAAYWTKSDADQNITLFGAKSDSVLIPVKAGWNMVSSFSEILPGSAVIQYPPDNINSKFFTYDRGYYFTDTLLPGAGYWVSVKEDGYLILTNHPISSSIALRENSTSDTGYRFFFTDAGGQRKTLHLTNDLQISELPPVPPEGSFDVRFRSRSNNSFGTETEHLNENEYQEFNISLSASDYPVNITGGGTHPGNSDAIVVNEIVDGRSVRSHAFSSLSGIQITDQNVKSIQIVINRSPELPVKFILKQNYPNPFNPTTNIKYEVRSTEYVSMNVYDVLGQVVATLVNEVKQPGEYTVQWDASASGGLPGGIYFYKLTSGKFTDSKKMMLLK